MKHLMVFHRSSFPVRPAVAWMRENAIALNQAKEPIRMNGCGRRASDSLQSTISGVAYAARIARAGDAPFGAAPGSP
jgi:hypothetical protein